MARDMEIPSDAPRPRLCHMIKRDDFNGYGFNLHAQKARPGQFIGIVDAGSPAEVAGLREGDRIIEVNGTNIAHENHRQVVERIKAIPNETTLLVVDKATEDYYRKLDVIVSKDLPNVDRKSSGLTMEAHAEPDSSTTLTPEPEIAEKVLEEPEPEAEVVGKVASFKIEEEEVEEMDEAEEPEPVDNDVTRRLSSRSSTSSAEKVDVTKEVDEEIPEIPIEKTSSKKTNNAEQEDEEVKGEIEEKKEEMEEIMMKKKVEIERELEQKKMEENLAKMEQEEKEKKEREEKEREEEKIKAQKEREEEKRKKEVEREREEEEEKKREEEEKREKEEKKKCEEVETAADSGKEDSEKTLSIGSESGSSLRSTPSPQPRSTTTKLEIPPAAASPSSSPTTPVSPSSASNWDGLNLNMTAAEMREMIGAKKKKDPRKDKSLDFRKKFEIIQTL